MAATRLYRFFWRKGRIRKQRTKYVVSPHSTVKMPFNADNYSLRRIKTRRCVVLHTTTTQRLWRCSSRRVQTWRRRTMYACESHARPLSRSQRPALLRKLFAVQYGITPLAEAIRFGYIRVAALLLEKGANTEAKNNVRMCTAHAPFSEFKRPLLLTIIRCSGRTDAADLCCRPRPQRDDGATY